MFFHKISAHLKQDSPHWLLFLDHNSMRIYILHHTLIWLAIYYITPIREFMVNNPVSGPWWLFSIVLPLSLLCSEYINKIKYLIYIYLVRYK